MAAVFPFGRLATRRPPRRPDGLADLLVLGVYPSALHVRWCLPDGLTIGALAVDDEPEVFWDGADAALRIDRWRADVGWREEWGSVALAGGNGSSGRVVVDDVLTPLGVVPDRTYFTDCLPYYFVKSGHGSQGHRMAAVYQPFAAEHDLPPADLPPRPKPADLVHRTVTEEADELRQQINEAGAAQIVTLGQEAADAFAGIAGVDPVELRPDEAYGAPRPAAIGETHVEWLPLTHPGNRTPTWRTRHKQWVARLKRN